MPSKFLNLDTDSSFTANSDYFVPSQKAIKTALDTKADVEDMNLKLADKQDTLTAGDGINIAEDGTISNDRPSAIIREW